MHTGLWELRNKEKEWLSEKAKLSENLPKDMQKHILTLSEGHFQVPLWMRTT